VKKFERIEREKTPLKGEKKIRGGKRGESERGGPPASAISEGTEESLQAKATRGTRKGV